MTSEFIQLTNKKREASRAKLGVELEKLVFAKHFQTPYDLFHVRKWLEYKSQCRSIVYNLKHCPHATDWANDLEWLSGASAAEMWPERWPKSTLQCLSDDSLEVRESMVSRSAYLKCKKCFKRHIEYTEFQTRGADEPSTIYYHCVSCHNRWRG